MFVLLVWYWCQFVRPTCVKYVCSCLFSYVGSDEIHWLTNCVILVVLPNVCVVGVILVSICEMWLKLLVLICGKWWHTLTYHLYHISCVTKYLCCWCDIGVNLLEQHVQNVIGIACFCMWKVVRYIDLQAVWYCLCYSCDIGVDLLEQHVWNVIGIGCSHMWEVVRYIDLQSVWYYLCY